MFHPDLTYDIVRLRHDELVADSHRRRGFGSWRRRRRTPPNAPSPRHLTVVPPPRPDEDQAGRDPRVA
jgi:hypothetical protein